MKETIIKGGFHRYLSELPEFKNELPFGVINKSKTDVGGTYVAANCDQNYIIICPFKDLVDSIANDSNNKYPIFKCYGGTKEIEFTKYCRENKIKKIAVTYDSFSLKLVNWITNPNDYKVLVDEYHLLLEDMDYREDAISGLIQNIKKFNHYSFLSATPISLNYDIDFLNNLPHYKVEWDGLTKITPIRYKTSNLNKGLARFIQIFIDEGFAAPDIDNEIKQVRELYIFLNSVTSIEQICRTLELPQELVKICCADRIRNRKLLNTYEIEPVSNPNKKINFFTKKCFQGCNLFTDNGLVIVASDGYKQQTLVDISTTMEQIAGRIRFDERDPKKQNIFRNRMIHLFSTNNRLLSDEEFEAEMIKKEEDANLLFSMVKDYTPLQMQVWEERTNLDADIVSIIGNKLVYNNLKKQSFIYKHELRKAYQNGINIRSKFAESDKFTLNNQKIWSDINIKLAKAMTVSYEELIKEYFENPNESFEMEYPEFKDYKQYLTLTEMNTARWNKDKMIALVNDKKQLNTIFKQIHREGFISCAELIEIFTVEFNKRMINLKPKATVIEQCKLYSVAPKQKRIEGKQVKGYMLGEFNKLKFTVL